MDHFVVCYPEDTALVYYTPPKRRNMVIWDIVVACGSDDQFECGTCRCPANAGNFHHHDCPHSHSILGLGLGKLMLELKANDRTVQLLQPQVNSVQVRCVTCLAATVDSARCVP